MSRCIPSIVVLIVMVCSSSAQGLNPDNGHTYELIPIPAGFTWHQARDSAETLGGYLATVTSATERDFIYSLVVENNVEECWLGGTDEATEGEWQWITGEPFEFEYWRDGEPNNAWPDEDYIQFGVDLSGRWNDARNWFVNPGYFLVERESSPQSLPKVLYVRGASFCTQFDSLLVAQKFAVYLDNTIPVPSVLSSYDLLIVNSYEPCNATTATYIESYLEIGGGVHLIAGTPWALSGNSTNLISISGWFGADSYSNSGGVASFVSNPAPFELELSDGALLFESPSSSNAAIESLHDPSQILGTWGDAKVFCFWRYHGNGRILYSASMLCGYNDANNAVLLSEGLKWAAGLYCCMPPTVGDIDQSGLVDITDVQALIDNQFLSLTPLPCDEEGDVDLNGVVDITDISVLIDNQFLSLSPLPECP